jgi:hypothetical protein
VTAAFPQGFKPCRSCLLTREYPDLCDMCEEIVARWEPEEDDAHRAFWRDEVAAQSDAMAFEALEKMFPGFRKATGK